MSLRHVCFLSYKRIDNRLYNDTIERIYQIFVEEFSLLMPEDQITRERFIFRDTSHIFTGNRINRALLEAICLSSCMILVYTSQYFRSRWCIQEFKLMQKIEQARWSKLNPKKEEKVNLILPIRYEGDEKASIPFLEDRNVFDMRILADHELLAMEPKLRQMARYIYQNHYRRTRDWLKATEFDSCLKEQLPDLTNEEFRDYKNLVDDTLPMPE